MPDNRTVYAYHGNEYEALIAREDHDGNILKALLEILPIQGRVVIDSGAGTGRLAGLLLPHVSKVLAFDISGEMLRVCRAKLVEGSQNKWQVGVADHRQLPVDDHFADLLVSGWSVSYLATWNPDSWRAELNKWMMEVNRVLRPGGFVVLFESLGTGNENPVRLEHLKDFYPWLDEAGFRNRWIRTDYKFDSLEEADYLSRFFFGDELGDKVRKNNWVILPECTGVWWKQV